MHVHQMKQLVSEVTEILNMWDGWLGFWATLYPWRSFLSRQTYGTSVTVIYQAGPFNFR